jgi:catechol 2,3-dioxygenase-like lactoylglutathione lyase family enzyme
MLGSVPVLPVDDAVVATAFYRDQLGFAVSFEVDDYAGVGRDDVQIHLDGVVNAAAGQVTARVTTVGVEALYTEFDAKRVVDPAEPLHTMPWGARQFSVLDCCGNRVTFVEGA